MDGERACEHRFTGGKHRHLEQHQDRLIFLGLAAYARALASEARDRDQLPLCCLMDAVGCNCVVVRFLNFAADKNTNIQRFALDATARVHGISRGIREAPPPRTLECNAASKLVPDALVPHV